MRFGVKEAVSAFSYFFLKVPRALRSHIRFLDAHANRTQRRRNCPRNLRTRYIQTRTPPHTRLSTQVRTGFEPPPASSQPRVSLDCCRSRCDPGATFETCISCQSHLPRKPQRAAWSNVLQGRSSAGRLGPGTRQSCST